MIIYINENLLGEKMMLSDYSQYLELIAKAYEEAPELEPGAKKHWDSLKNSNYTLFKRLLSKVNVLFVSEHKSYEGKTFNILGRKFDVKYIKGGQPYQTQPEMKSEVQKTGILKINIDYSEHPIFSVEDNIVMRTIHDYLTHIQANVGFGGKGEIAAFNVHAKLAPNLAIPALFTEVVGQAAYATVYGKFPVQKIAILHGFDYTNLGEIDDDNYHIVNKKLVPKTGEDKYKNVERETKDFKAISNN